MASLVCLGIESTAHTFSIGIVNSDGKILSMVGKTFIPETGGLHPQKVVEHHSTIFSKVLLQAMTEANISYSDLNLIAFSQGPGLGPCLRIGAAVARALALKLKLPIVGVNHCIAHVEIGRLMCSVDDPVTLYLSGGNTIVSAFDCDHYQIFGETLDLPIGNMLDMVARDLDIPHPGGPKLEQMAKKGQKYLDLPYIVKGMDLSYSGFYSAVSSLLKIQKKGAIYTIEDVIYSLQETAFAMLAEVTERALAHTQKKDVLLTGGVAANSRIQEMIAYICADHQATFHCVPLKLAGDNGAMIAWTGILKFLTSGADDINQTEVLSKWRMDEPIIPWRLKNASFSIPSRPIASNELLRNPHINPIIPRTDQEIIKTLGFEGVLLSKGAEAALICTKWQNRSVIVKYRIPKNYRLSEIDSRLRMQRTILESRVLLDLGEKGIPVPVIYDVNPSQGYFIMKFIEGKRLKDMIPQLASSELSQIFFQIGMIIAQIHMYNWIHGDLTTSNIIYTLNKSLFFIDFGLAQNTTTIEDRAVDLHLFKRVITSTHNLFFEDTYPAFIQGYIQGFGKGAHEIIEKIALIELRGRYISKEKRRKL